MPKHTAPAGSRSATISGDPMNDAFITYETRPEELVVGIRGHWRFENVTALELASHDIAQRADRHVVFQCDGLEDIDIAGAWVLYDRSQQLTEAGLSSEFKGFQAGHFKFLRHIIDAHAVREYAHELDTPPPPHPLRHFLERLGSATYNSVNDVGQITRSLADGMLRPNRMSLSETIRQVYYTGVQAIPVVMMISFLIGIVLAYQGASQLERFGARIFVVDMVSIAVLREMAALLAAVMVAGRSGSAFAAALGTMKLNEEVDALRVLGLNPNQVLILPRVLGLLIALPALTLFADLAGLAGGAVITIGVLDISWVQFVERVANSASMNDLLAGLVKAPFFAFLIACVATLRGMQVQQSAEELGLKTTQAVVESIVLIIVADAFFTTIFTRIGF
jgi:phospholipid/cholesterol/gamma-HCH transport system permease protein